MGSDKMILRYVYEKPYTVRFPDRSIWYMDCREDTTSNSSYIVVRVLIAV
jgi:hypothetical protein